VSAPRRVRKAVIPAAGLGTRFLPATKAQPKEMLPVVDTPAIQYVVEEAVAAGIDDILIITGRNKRAIEDHFDRNVELELELEAKGKDVELADVRRLADLADIHYVRQGEPLGLGHAVSVARKHVGDEPFVVMLGDDLMDGPGLLGSMIDVHERLGRSVVALMEVPGPEISFYGCAATSTGPEDGLVRIEGLVEKPAPDEAPSNLAVMGRYLFTPSIFEALERVAPGRGGEIQLTDAIALLLADEEVLGRTFTSGRFDTGNKLDYLKATVELALRRPDLGEPFRAWLKEHLGT
jgi:UTP--glucose-1-phosphate uridylyltransferase